MIPIDKEGQNELQELLPLKVYPLTLESLRRRGRIRMVYRKHSKI